jgi:hypothetical protein
LCVSVYWPRCLFRAPAVCGGGHSGGLTYTFSLGYYLCVRGEYACLSLVRKKGVVVDTHLAVLGAVGDVLALSAQQHLVERLAAVCIVAQPDRKGHLALARDCVRWGELGGLACGRKGKEHTKFHAESNQGLQTIVQGVHESAEAKTVDTRSVHITKP